MIYFIQCGDNGPIKIGTTGSAPHARMSHFQLGCPYELRLLGAVDGGALHESAIHELHLEDHIRGEWFRPSAAVLATVRTALEAGAIDKCRLGALPKRREHPKFARIPRNFLNDHSVEERAA